MAAGKSGGSSDAASLALRNATVAMRRARLAVSDDPSDVPAAMVDGSEQ